MKKAMLAASLVLALSLAAQAQVTFEYEKKKPNSTLKVQFGYPNPYYGPGFVGDLWGGTVHFGVTHNFYGYGWPGSGYGYGYGYGPAYSPYMSPYYYGTPRYRYSDPLAEPVGTPLLPPPPARPVADRSAEFEVARRIEEGLKRFKAADYKAARDEFRGAVAADTSSASAQAHFALALSAVADHKNADKALRGAAERAPFGKIDVTSLFKDEKEKARVLGLLAKVTGDGALAAAWLHALAGDPAKLKALAEKDAAAKKLQVQ